MVAWTEDLNKRLLELDATRYTQVRMAEILAVEFPDKFTYGPPTRDQVKNALADARMRARHLAHKPITEIMPFVAKYEAQIKGAVVVEKNRAVLEAILAKPKRKILVISDLHVPFTDEEKLQEAIEMNRSADMVVIAGDLMDCYGSSRWRKDKNVPHEVELDRTVRLLEYLSETFPWVRIVRGNHDARVMKKVQDSLPAELLYLFQNEPLDLLVRPFSNVEYVGSWWTQVGDAIIAHGEISSIVDGKPVAMLMDYFFAKGWAERLALPEIRVIVNAHTHQQNVAYREGVKLIESGCLAEIQGYAVDSSAVMRTPKQGYVVINQYNGRSNWNDTREFSLW